MESVEAKTLKPLAIRYYEGIHRSVEAKGFSQAELREAKMTVQEARKQGIRVDTRRKSKNDPNVTLLKEWKSKSKPQPKRVRKQRFNKKAANPE